MQAFLDLIYFSETFELVELLVVMDFSMHIELHYVKIKD